MRRAKIDLLHSKLVPDRKPETPLESMLTSILLRTIDTDTLEMLGSALDKLDGGRQPSSQERALIEEVERRAQNLNGQLRSCTTEQQLRELLSSVLPWAPTTLHTIENLTAEIWPGIQETFSREGV